MLPSIMHDDYEGRQVQVWISWTRVHRAMAALQTEVPKVELEFVATFLASEEQVLHRPVHPEED